MTKIVEKQKKTQKQQDDSLNPNKILNDPVLMKIAKKSNLLPKIPEQKIDINKENKKNNEDQDPQVIY